MGARGQEVITMESNVIIRVITTKKNQVRSDVLCTIIRILERVKEDTFCQSVVERPTVSGNYNYVSICTMECFRKLGETVVLNDHSFNGDTMSPNRLSKFQQHNQQLLVFYNNFYLLSNSNFFFFQLRELEHFRPIPR